MKTFKVLAEEYQELLEKSIGGDLKKIGKLYQELRLHYRDAYRITYSEWGINLFDGKKYIATVSHRTYKLEDALKEIEDQLKNKGKVGKVGKQPIDWKQQKSKDGWTGD